METTYKDKTITLHEKTFRFQIEGLESRWFESMAECQAFIDETLKKEQLQERKKLALPVITRVGERTTITGIHGNTGQRVFSADDVEEFFTDGRPESGPFQNGTSDP